MMSVWARLLLTAVLPGVLWLLYGQPKLGQAGNAALCLYAFGLLLGMMWHDEIAKLLSADVYTYAFVSIALNTIIGVVGLIAVGVLFYVQPSGYETLGDVSGLIWAGLLLILGASWIIPIFTSTKVTSLPDRNGRREFQDPSKS
jgi:hypothetical protein